MSIWAGIKFFLNDTVGRKNHAPLNKIIQKETYDRYYDLMHAHYESGAFNSLGYEFFPNGRESIPANYYSLNASIRRVFIPSTVVAIETKAFLNCSSLDMVILPSSVKYMATDIFSGCESLNHIFVHANKGELLHAPWGATGATIHYNDETVYPE